MKELKKLLEMRNEQDQKIREYRESFLMSPLSIVIGHCFLNAEKFSYNQETLKNFRRYLDELGGKQNVISLDAPVEQLRLESSLVVDRLLANASLSAMQKKLRMHALIFLFKFLEQETGGAIKGLQMPPELAKMAPVRSEDRTAATYEEVRAILTAAETVSFRDFLVLKTIYETEQPLHMILALKCENMNFEDRIISGTNNIITIELMHQLKKYFRSTALIRGECSNFFISNQGKPLYRTQVQKTLDKANQALQLPFRITTKMIQRSKKAEEPN